LSLLATSGAGLTTLSVVLGISTGKNKGNSIYNGLDVTTTFNYL